MIWTFLIFIISSSLEAEVPECVHSNQEFRCVEFVGNYDGDTITVNIPNVHHLISSHMRVRLQGVDTPEIKGKSLCERKKAVQAKELVANLLKTARQIHLKNIKKGKYFRVVADVEFDGKDLGLILLDKSLAYPYSGGKKQKKDWCL